MSDHHHCPTCICGRRAVVQGDGSITTHRAGTLKQGAPGYGRGTVSWEEHCAAWTTYAQRYGRDHSAERIFGYGELTELLGHPPKSWSSR